MHKHLVVAMAAALSVAGLTAAPTNTFADREVVVKPGDSMQDISRRFYGDEDHVWTITRFNHLENPGLIYAGLTLVLPDVSGGDSDGEPGRGGRTADLMTRSGATSSNFDTTPEPPPPAGAADAAPSTFTLPVLSAPASPDAQPGVSLAVPMAADAAVPGRPIQSGLATWYGPGFVGNITYCGDIYDEWAYTAASNTLPCGLVVIVTNRDTGASVRVRITDRGGFGGAVIMDLSRAAFGAIASNSDGVVPITVSQPAP
jgi:hypothetical protein